MATWTFYTPTPQNRAQKGKQPRAKIHVTPMGKLIIINSLLAKELGFNSLTNYATLRYDKERNVMGLQFHQKQTERTVRVGRRKSFDGKTDYTVNVAQFLKDIVNVELAKGTYTTPWSRESDILVLDLACITETTSV